MSENSPAMPSASPMRSRWRNRNRSVSPPDLVSARNDTAEYTASTPAALSASTAKITARSAWGRDGALAVDMDETVTR